MLPTNAVTVPLLAILVVAALGWNAPSRSACNIVGGKAYGDCGGVQVRTAAPKFLQVQTYISESAIIAGAQVDDGGTLELSGLSQGEIVVNEGGVLRLTGTINGVVSNFGGYVEIEGSLDHLHITHGQAVIGGIVDHISGAGSVILKEGAIVAGKPVSNN